MREAGGGLAAEASFDLGTISSYRLTALPPSAPLLSSYYHSWRCRLVGHQSADAAKVCGYGYLLGERSATHQLLQLSRMCDAVWGTNPTALLALHDALADNTSTAELQVRVRVRVNG